jgi:glycosyltransferase involved in cell wall biosynthesis
MPALSVIIPTYNEADNLPLLLPLLSWADEVLVVDSYSTDETVAIARRFGCKVLQRPYQSPADQKNWAMQQAQHDWVLLLDADERPDEHLCAELQLLLKTEPQHRAYWVSRRNFFLGKLVRYGGWGSDKVIRLADRRHCHYPPKQVHEEIECRGSSGWLQQPLDHYTYKDLRHFIAKQERYARWSAQDKAAKTGSLGPWHFVAKPFFRFCKHYLWQRGFLDGYRGLIIASIMAWSVFLRYAHLWELRQEKPKT